MRLAAAILTLATIASTALAAGDAVDGQREFGGCAACHSVESGRNGIGPSLRSVVGRQSGTVEGYHYSPAMTGAHITWDDASLNKYLANPQGAVHGTKMFFTVPDEHRRLDIIAWLNTLK